MSDQSQLISEPTHSSLKIGKNMAEDHIAYDGRVQSGPVRPAGYPDRRIKSFRLQTVDAAAMHSPLDESSVLLGKLFNERKALV
jgi:hypothetical protein